MENKVTTSFSILSVLLLQIILIAGGGKVDAAETEKLGDEMERYVVAFDIEASGSSYTRNGVLSIGASLQNSRLEELLQFQVNMTLPQGRSFDPVCLREFWDRNPEAKRFVENGAVSPEVAMMAFSQFLDDVEARYPEVELVSDNPSFDISWLDTYLDVYANRKPLRYTRDGRYRMVWDSASIQKKWLCLRNGITSMVTPSNHRKALGFNSPHNHDHNPLNDARNIAHFYLETLNQMQKYLQAKEGVKTVRKIELSEYDANWRSVFEVEDANIRRVLGEECIEVHHVGSTSVPGLLAKPIVDIIVVVKPGVMPDLPLERIGYKYKGEYNLPLRRMYGKKAPVEIYLHVHEMGSPEIDLNLKFRDFLRANQAARTRYSDLKRAILENRADHSKLTSTGITTYNLEKNAFIKEILKASGFNGICPRLCTQEEEWDFYNEKRKGYTLSSGVAFEDPANKHLVLYRGTELIGAANVIVTPPNAFIAFVSQDDSIEDYRAHMILFIEKWIARLGVRFITVIVPRTKADIYDNLGYKVVSSDESKVSMMKVL